MGLENLFELEDESFKGYEVRIAWDDPYLAKRSSNFRRKLEEKVRRIKGILIEGERESRIYFSPGGFSYSSLKELRDLVNVMEIREVKVPRRIFLDLYSREKTWLTVSEDMLIGKAIRRLGPFLVASELSFRVSRESLLSDPEEEILGSLLFSPEDGALGKAEEVSRKKALYALRGRKDPKRILGIRVKGSYYLPEDLVKVIPWTGKETSASIPDARRVRGENVEVDDFEILTKDGKYPDAFEAVSERARPYLIPKAKVVATYHDKASKDFCEELESLGILDLEVEPEGTETEKEFIISDSGPYKYFLGNKRRDPFRLLLQVIEDLGGWYCVASKPFLGPMLFVYSSKEFAEMTSDVSGLPSEDPLEPSLAIGNPKGLKTIRRNLKEVSCKISLKRSPPVYSSSKGIFKAGPYYFVCSIPGGVCYYLKGSEEEAKLIYYLSLMNPHFQVNKYTSRKIRGPYHLHVLERWTRASGYQLSSRRGSLLSQALSRHLLPSASRSYRSGQFFLLARM